MSSSTPLPSPPLTPRAEPELVFDGQQQQQHCHRHVDEDVIGKKGDSEMNDGVSVSVKADPSSPLLLDGGHDGLRDYTTMGAHSSTPGKDNEGESRRPSPWTTRLSSGWWWRRVWQQNRAPLFVFFSQLCASLMNLCARILETDEEKPMHPMQLLLIRMGLTLVCTVSWMYYRRTPNVLLGPRGTRILLALRGVSGFFGIYGMWCAAMVIPLAEATVLSFLAPVLACYLCSIFLKERFSRQQQLASLLALGGVVLIARPTALFGGDNGSIPGGDDGGREEVGMEALPDLHPPTTKERLGAIGMSLLGVVGTSVAILSLRWIGSRASPLHTVNYFSVVSTVVALVALGVGPAVGFQQDPRAGPVLQFEWPTEPEKWGLMVGLAIAGFGTQYFLAKGLQGEKGARATAMMYTQMLFAAGFDRFIFGHMMEWVSLVGCIMVIGGAVWAALAKDKVEGDEEINKDSKDSGDVEAGKSLLSGGNHGESRFEGPIEVRSSGPGIE